MRQQRRFARDGLASLCWASLVVVSCGGETDAGKTAAGGGGGSTSGGAGGSTSGGAGGSTSGGAGGATTGGSGGAAGSGGNASVGSVTCGSFSVPKKDCAANEYCCDADCVADGSPCAGYAFHCDDATDCPGAFCCVTKLAKLDGGFNQVAQCQSTCDSDTQLIVCNHPAGGCPSGMTCQITATLPPQYGYCCPSGQPCSAI